MADAKHTRNLVIGNVTIWRDENGRYSLNALYRASAAEKDKEPNKWSRLKTTQELINQVNSQTPDLAFETVTGGNRPGTWAVEMLAVAYAAWISAEFHVIVLQAFLDLRDLKREGFFDGKALTPNQMFLQQAHINIEMEKRIDVVEKKADLALAQQLWLTIDQYVYLNDLERQMPHSARKAFGLYLSGYCIDNAIHVEKRGVAYKQWSKDNAYHVQVIADLLPGWLKRYNGQIGFSERA